MSAIVTSLLAVKQLNGHEAQLERQGGLCRITRQPTTVEDSVPLVDAHGKVHLVISRAAAAELTPAIINYLAIQGWSVAVHTVWTGRETP